MTRIDIDRAAEVLALWFGESLQGTAAGNQSMKRWFRYDPQFDAEIRQRFGDLPDQAAAGNLDAWISVPEAALARLIVLDQFPRNLYRHDARAFAFDRLGVAGSLAAIERGFDARLHPLQAVFVYLPFEHAEDLVLQQRAVDHFTALQARAPAGAESRFESFTDYARRHHAVIARFGRFPHRNALLGRVTTAAEQEYLDQGGERFGAKGS